MSNVPEGAQLSDDGQWYWDGSAWKPVEGGSNATPGGQSADAGTGPDQWSANPDEWTDEQREMFFTVNDQTVAPEPLDADDDEPQEIKEDIA